MNNFFKAEFENPFYKKSQTTSNKKSEPSKEINNSESSNNDSYNYCKNDQIKLDILESKDDIALAYSKEHKKKIRSDGSDDKTNHLHKNKRNKLNSSQNYLYSVINQFETNNDENIYLKELSSNENRIKCTSKILNTTC